MTLLSVLCTSYAIVSGSPQEPPRDTLRHCWGLPVSPLSVGLSWYPACVVCDRVPGRRVALSTAPPESFLGKQAVPQGNTTHRDSVLPPITTYLAISCLSSLNFSFHCHRKDRKGRITQSTSKLLLWEGAFPSCTHLCFTFLLNTYMQNTCQLLGVRHALSVMMRSLIHIWILIDSNYYHILKRLNLFCWLIRIVP